MNQSDKAPTPFFSVLNPGGCLNIKRLHLNTELVTVCAGCGNTVSNNYDCVDNFSYPIINAPFEVIVHCPDCDFENPVTVTIAFGLSVEKATVQE